MPEDSTPHNKQHLENEDSSIGSDLKINDHLDGLPQEKTYNATNPNPVDPPAVKLFWAKIALIGAAAFTPLAISTYILSKFDTWEIFGLLILGILPIGVILLQIVITLISAKYLKQLGFQHSFVVAAISVFFITPLVVTLSRVIPGEIGGVAYIICGALGFCLTTYMIEKAKPIIAVSIVATMIAVPFLIVTVFNQMVKNDTSGYFSVLPVKSHHWKLLPNPLPQGIIDATYVTDNTVSCAETRAYFAYYDCEYTFQYPGYLSTQSQTVFSKAMSTGTINSIDSLNPRIYVTVTRDHKTLGSYKYFNEQCDIQGLSSAARDHRKQDYSVINPTATNPSKCGVMTTPGGTKLYYDSSYFSNKIFEPIPHDFFFERSGNIVFVRVGNEAPQEGTLGAVYYVDPNYQSEIYKFVDSFK